MAFPARPAAEVVLCLFTWILLLPTLAIPALLLLALFAWRCVVNTIARCVRPGWTPVYPPDCVHGFGLRMEAPKLKPTTSTSTLTCSGNYGCYLIFEEALPLDLLRSELQKRVVHNPNFHRLRQRPRRFLGYTFWTSVANIDIRQHVYDLQVKGQPASVSVENTFNEWLQLDFCGRPPWEFATFKATAHAHAHDGKTILCFKMNHLLGDASTARMILKAIWGHDPNITEPAQIPALRKLTHAQLLYQIVIFPKSLLYLGSMTRLDHLFKTPAKRPIDSICCSGQFDHHSIKAISKANHCRFGEVLFCTFASSIQKYALSQARTSPQATVGCSLAIPWMYSIRTGHCCNSATAAIFQYPLVSAIDPVHVRAQVRNNVRMGIDRLIFYSTYLTWVIPGPMLKLMRLDEIPAAILTADIPITGRREYLFGRYEVLGLYFAMSLQGSPRAGGFAAFATVADKVNYTICVNKNFVRGQGNTAAAEITQFMRMEVDNMLAKSQSQLADPQTHDRLLASTV